MGKPSAALISPSPRKPEAKFPSHPLGSRRPKKAWPGPTLAHLRPVRRVHRPAPRRKAGPVRSRGWGSGQRVIGWLWRSFTLCRIAGVPVQIHSTTLVFPIGFLFWAGWCEDWGRHFSLLLTLFVILWLSILGHEFAHILTARAHGAETERLLFVPGGGAAFLKDVPLIGGEFWIAVAGPLANFALAGICLLIAHCMDHWIWSMPIPFLRAHLWLFKVVKYSLFGWKMNLLLGLSNLFPCYPMDGGRVLRSLLSAALWKFTRRSRGQAILLATWISVRYVSWPLALGVVALSCAQTDFQSLDLREAPLFVLAIAVEIALLLFTAEREYLQLRTQDAIDDPATAPAAKPAPLKCPPLQRATRGSFVPKVKLPGGDLRARAALPSRPLPPGLTLADFIETLRCKLNPSRRRNHRRIKSIWARVTVGILALLFSLPGAILRILRSTYRLFFPYRPPKFPCRCRAKPELLMPSGWPAPLRGAKPLTSDRHRASTAAFGVRRYSSAISKGSRESFSVRICVAVVCVVGIHPACGLWGGYLRILPKDHANDLPPHPIPSISAPLRSRRLAHD